MKECGMCRWFIEDEDGGLLNLVPVMCCDEACEDYEEG